MVVVNVLALVGLAWCALSMFAVWVPIVAKMWLPDSWLPAWFPGSITPFLPESLQWIPIPWPEPVIWAAVLLNLVVAAPGILVFFLADRLGAEI